MGHYRCNEFFELHTEILGAITYVLPSEDDNGTDTYAIIYGYIRTKCDPCGGLPGDVHSYCCEPPESSKSCAAVHTEGLLLKPLGITLEGIWPNQDEFQEFGETQAVSHAWAFSDDGAAPFSTLPIKIPADGGLIRFSNTTHYINLTPDWVVCCSSFMSVITKPRSGDSWNFSCIDDCSSFPVNFSDIYIPPEATCCKFSSLYPPEAIYPDQLIPESWGIRPANDYTERLSASSNSIFLRIATQDNRIIQPSLTTWSPMAMDNDEDPDLIGGPSQNTYTIIDIGGLGGGPDGTVINTNANDINNNNVVVGESWSIALPCWDRPDLLCHLHQAIMWTQKDGLIDLGTLPGDTSSRVRAINNNNEIVGYSCHCGAFNTVRKAVFWPALTTASNIPPRPIPLLASNFEESTASDISDDGIVVGGAGPWPDYVGSKWINRQWYEFDETSGSVSMQGLNNNGVFIGNAFNDDPFDSGNVWESASGPMIELPSSWRVEDINDSNIIVGRCLCNGPVGSGPAQWEKVGGQWELTELEVPDTSDIPEGCSLYLCNGTAKGINNQGIVVGQIKNVVGPGGWATIWENGKPRFLEDLIDSNESWRLYSANAINDNGWIVGTGKPSGAEALRGFVLIPTQ